MKKTLMRLSLAACVCLLPSVAAAQIVVALPSSTQSTMLTATVSEQARVSVPAGVSFSVADIGSATAATAAAVTIDQIVLATATKQLQVSVQAAVPDFTPSVPLTPTWAATDVSWNAASWTQGTGSAGTLSSSGYNVVATCAAGVSACSTTQLVFTLGSNGSITNAGSHTLSITWKIESIGS